MELELRRLRPDPAADAEIAALTAVMLAAPNYMLCVAGRLPCADDATELLRELPPGYLADDKFTYGLYLDGEMVGCADLLRGWKHSRQAMLGLLLLAERVQGRGVGRSAFRQLEELVRSWPGMASIRIGVVSTNAGALAFWRKMGFAETGEQVLLQGYTGPTLILEKEVEALSRAVTSAAPHQ